MKRIKVIINREDEYPFEAMVDATDRIVIYSDEDGSITIRSDGERFDTINKTEENKQVYFNEPLDVFKSKPWNL